MVWEVVPLEPRKPVLARRPMVRESLGELRLLPACFPSTGSPLGEPLPLIASIVWSSSRPRGRGECLGGSIPPASIIRLQEPVSPIARREWLVADGMVVRSKARDCFESTLEVDVVEMPVDVGRRLNRAMARELLGELEVSSRP